MVRWFGIFCIVLCGACSQVERERLTYGLVEKAINVGIDRLLSSRPEGQATANHLMYLGATLVALYTGNKGRKIVKGWRNGNNTA